MSDYFFYSLIFLGQKVAKLQDQAVEKQPSQAVKPLRGEEELQSLVVYMSPRD